MIVRDVTTVAYVMNTVVLVSVLQDFMGIHVKIYAKLRLGDRSVNIFVIMMMLTFFLLVDQNCSAFHIHLVVLVDLVGPDQNVIDLVQMGGTVPVVRWSVIARK